MKKKAKIITIIGIVTIILTVGISYAIYVASISQSGEGTILSKCIGITKTSEENNINLQNAMPMTDSDGLELIPYTITVTNTCDVATNFIITVDLLNIEGKTSSDYIPSSVVKSSVNGTITLLSSNEEYPTINNSYESRIIYYGIFAGLETKEFNIRMWLDERATVEQAGNKFLNTKISVYSGQVPTSVDNIIVDIDDNMIPIMYYNNEWVVADKTNENATYKWYDYEEKQWANAVTIVPSELTTYKAKNVGDIIDNDDVMGYFVYIPRYRYKLWNVNNDGTQTSNEQEIIIEFENKNVGKVLGNTNGDYLTHPSFTFGEEELNGFWIGKFETGSTIFNEQVNYGAYDMSKGAYIKPNLYPITYHYPYRYYVIATDLSNSNYHNLSLETESIMITNMQWGAVTYLSHSKYGTCNNGVCSQVMLNSKGIRTNDILSSFPVTGCGPQGINNFSPGTICNEYNTSLGILASTTKNIYGVYDMAGGVLEFTMGVIKDEGTNVPQYSGSRFDDTNMPSNKYYNLYEYGISDNNAEAFVRGKLGDATKEIVKYLDINTGSWYNDTSQLVENGTAWSIRGGYFANYDVGIFAFNNTHGWADNNKLIGFRVVLISK